MTKQDRIQRIAGDLDWGVYLEGTEPITTAERMAIAERMASRYSDREIGKMPVREFCAAGQVCRKELAAGLPGFTRPPPGRIERILDWWAAIDGGSRCLIELIFWYGVLYLVCGGLIALLPDYYSR